MPILTPVPLNDKIEFSANATKSIKIPRNRFIREIQMRLECKAVNGATGPTLQEDNPLGLVKRIRLKKNGKDIVFDAPMTDRFYEQHYLEGTEAELTKTSTTASATSTAIAEVSIEFAVDETNDEDISALLPAAQYTDLELEVDWGTNTDLATANAPTITAADTFVKVTLIEASLTDEDLAALAEELGTDSNGNPKMLSKLVSFQEFTVDATYNNYAFSKNIKVGGLVQRHYIKVIDNSVRNDTLVTDLKFKQYGKVEQPVDLKTYKWPSLQSKNKRAFGIETIRKGVAIVLWENFLDLVALSDGDVKYEHINGAQTATAKVAIMTTDFT